MESKTYFELIYSANIIYQKLGDATKAICKRNVYS